MQTTARKIIGRALRLLGVVASGVDPTDEEATDSFDALKDMIDQWHTNAMMSYSSAEASFTGSSATVTVGTGGNINITNPQHLQYVKWNGVDLDVCSSFEEFKSGDLSVGTPERAFYSKSNPLSNLLLAPAPTVSGTVKIGYLAPLIQFTGLDVTVDLPEGCSKMLSYNLALEMAPEFEKEPSQLAVVIANNTVADFKRMNTQVPLLRVSPEVASLGHGNEFDVTTG